MFFPERIKEIKDTDKVLEIGPGATPHPRSDVFLEKVYDTEEELILQSGNVGILKTDKTVVTYHGGKFPFKDKEFDYVICSHVLEHVEDVPFFLEEIMRVASRGYLEFPTIYYDYYNDIPTHVNMLRYKNGVILWCKKSQTPIPDLKPFTKFFNRLQEKGYRMQNEVNHAWHQGFEWENNIDSEEVSDWQKLCFTDEELTSVVLNPIKVQEQKVYGVRGHFVGLCKEIKRKLRI